MSECTELLNAARHYVQNYLLDEYKDARLCCCGEEQHRALVALFDAIKDAEKAALRAPAPDLVSCDWCAAEKHKGRHLAGCPNEPSPAQPVSEPRYTVALAAEHVHALYLTLYHGRMGGKERPETRPAYGWMEQPLVDIENALEPLHSHLHGLIFNAMNRQFFGDGSRALPVSAAPALPICAAPDDNRMRAAELLRDHAKLLRDSHTVPPSHTDWTGEEEAKATYDELMAVASNLNRRKQ